MYKYLEVIKYASEHTTRVFFDCNRNWNIPEKTNKLTFELLYELKLYASIVKEINKTDTNRIFDIWKKVIEIQNWPLNYTDQPT